MEEILGIMVALAAILGIFVVIPLVVFLIVRKILNDRHRERMAMIEHGLDPKRRGVPPVPEKSAETPLCQQKEEPQRSALKPEDSTVKWMYVFGGAAAGLLVASVVTNLLFTYTLIETRGLGLSIVVLSVCIALYIYYARKNRKGRGNPSGGSEKNGTESGMENYSEN